MGQTGTGSKAEIGDEPGEMGDNLPYVDLGSNHTALAVTAGEKHSCALLDNHTIKCWGYNGGLLGLGDPNNRGDEPGEMGDALPPVVYQ